MNYKLRDHGLMRFNQIADIMLNKAVNKSYVAVQRKEGEERGEEKVSL